MDKSCGTGHETEVANMKLMIYESVLDETGKEYDAEVVAVRF